MKRIVLVFTIILLSSKAFGCICYFSTEKKPLKRRIKEANVIVYALATTTDSAEANLDSIRSANDVVFRIYKVWKGNSGADTITFAPKKYPCEGAAYKVGERYIIFGYVNATSQKLEANNCTSLSEGTRRNEILEAVELMKLDLNLTEYLKFKQQDKKEFQNVKNLIARMTRRYNR